MKTQIVGVSPIKNNRFKVDIIERRLWVFQERRTINVLLSPDELWVVRSYYTDTFEHFKDESRIQNILDWLKAPIV